MSERRSILFIAIGLMGWVWLTVFVSILAFHASGLQVGSVLSALRGSAYESAVMVAAAPMWGPGALMDLSPSGGLSATVDFAIEVLKACLGLLLWAALIYGVWRALRNALSPDSLWSPRRSIGVLTLGLLLYLLFVTLLSSACGGPYNFSENWCGPVTYHLIMYGLAPAYGPASLVLKFVSVDIVTMCPLLLLQTIANCLFWATIIYYSSRAIHRRRYR